MLKVVNHSDGKTTSLKTENKTELIYMVENRLKKFKEMKENKQKPENKEFVMYLDSQIIHYQQILNELMK